MMTQRVEPDIVLTGLFADGQGEDFDVFPASVGLKVKENSPDGFRDFFCNVIEFDFPREEVAPPSKEQRTWGGKVYEDTEDLLLYFRDYIETIQMESDEEVTLQRLFFVTELSNRMR